jgi:serine/threonine protein kinase
LNLAENTVVAGRFRLNRLLGRGGMGSIWHATHLGLDIPCAVKFIEGHLAEMADMNARFEREAKAAAKLRSPHVVQILDHGIWEGIPYIAMELLEGEDLGKRLERVHTFSPAEVVAIVDQVTRALSKAHASGIVHRDLKPDNIFLVRDDDREIAKVLDFGIAKTGVELASGATKTGAMLGTPYYMSPEQAQGIKAVDYRSDVWSLAVIVFECVTGHRPFESEALGDLLMRIMVAPLPVPSHVASVPPGFDAWWARAAMREPSQRFQSAKEMADALALALGITQTRLAAERTAMSPGPPEAPVAAPAPAPASAIVAPAPGPTTMNEAPLPLVVRAKLAATTGSALAHTHGEDSLPPIQKRSRAGFYAAAIVGLAGAAVIFAFVRSRGTSEGPHASPSISTVSSSTAAAVDIPAPATQPPSATPATVTDPSPASSPAPSPPLASPPRSATPAVESPVRKTTAPSATTAGAHDAGAATSAHTSRAMVDQPATPLPPPPPPATSAKRPAAPGFESGF